MAIRESRPRDGAPEWRERLGDPADASKPSPESVDAVRTEWLKPPPSGGSALVPGGDLFSRRSPRVVAQLNRDARTRPPIPNALTPKELGTIREGLPDLTHRLREALVDLGRVAKLEDLGKQGPLDASGGKESLFKAFFGRDSGKIARHLQSAFKEVGRQTILRQAGLQGLKSDVRSDEEPGRILHEYRPEGDPIGDKELVPKWGALPYFGTIDATPNFINLVAEHVEQYGPGILDEKVKRRDGSEATIGQAVDAAAQWVERRLDTALGGGLLWVQRSQNEGIPFQSWIDAADSRFHDDGKVIDRDRPHIPLQDQGYAYRALMNAAALVESRGGSPARAETLQARAKQLRDDVIEKFWLDDLGVFSPALVPGERGHWKALRTVSSEAWALLDSRLLDGDDVADKRERLIHNLVSDRFKMIAKGGVRTKSANKEHNARYWPNSYQNGSSWQHDTKEIADGLRRYGYHELANDLELRILLSCIANRGFPEYVQGVDDAVTINKEVVDIVEPDGFHNRLEQPPQDPQGWTVSSVFGILFGHGIVGKDVRADGAADRFSKQYGLTHPMASQPPPARYP